MSKNIEININTSTNTYEILYPKTQWTNIINAPTLPLSVANGGTGVNNYEALLKNLNPGIHVGRFQASYTGTGSTLNNFSINASGMMIDYLPETTTNYPTKYLMLGTKVTNQYYGALEGGSTKYKYTYDDIDMGNMHMSTYIKTGYDNAYAFFTCKLYVGFGIWIGNIPKITLTETDTNIFNQSGVTYIAEAYILFVSN